MAWNLDQLSARLKEVAPKGKKDGRWFWADSVLQIKMRLMSFLNKFPVSEEFTEDDVVASYSQYLKDTEDAFTHQVKTNRRLLKYFIWKQDGSGDISSDLLTYLGNKGEWDTNTETQDQNTDDPVDSWNNILI